MSTVMSGVVPEDCGSRIKSARGVMGLTQTQFANRIGVSFASVNRWENGQSRPNKLAWRRIVELEREAASSLDVNQDDSAATPATAPVLDFAADPNVVSVLAEAHRLAWGHLFNPTFATETSSIDPLPHQRIAVYETMLKQAPLRFLLADDAGAGKTIMTGLYVREMLARGLIGRVLIVPPAGLVGNWEREMRSLFRLGFRIVQGTDARTGNPFTGPESDLVIVSVDTLAGERMFAQLGSQDSNPYDLVVFDEAHKLSAHREAGFRVRKTDRYKLAEAIAGAESDDSAYTLQWSAQHLLLLTATPHMGKDYPYYALWRLLLPETLTTQDAFEEFSRESRSRHFLRRTKEEMVHFNGSPLYPQRNCDTLSYSLSQGTGGEQELYDETTDYIKHFYNRAEQLNRSAARLAMSVFQRRLASSTYALMRSFERREEKLRAMIDAIRDGSVTEEQLVRQQRLLDDLEDVFETRTFDEDAEADDAQEQDEAYESRMLGGIVAASLSELEDERQRVEGLLSKARKRLETGEESKFEKLREVLEDPNYADEKFIIFTEHRDTAMFLVRRLEGLGFTGRVALIHGGQPYRERERQVEFFRRPSTEGGASYLVATDAAGEGINLQFCWLMVNYDIPWNPARLEQRMGRIHRYGQEHDPVIVVNLIAGSTREGGVLKTLLEKLEAMRRQLQSDKVFDVVGRLFAEVSIREYLEQAVTEDAATASRQLESKLTVEQVQALEQRERSLFGEGGEVRRRLDRLSRETEQESFRRLLPGYVRRFVAKAVPRLDLRVDGDLEKTFTLVPGRARAGDSLLSALDVYPETAQGELTVYKPARGEDVVWMHPGEPVFDAISSSIIGRYGHDGLRGSVFIDPEASEPYLFHIARIAVEEESQVAAGSVDLTDANGGRVTGSRLVDARLIGLRQSSDGKVEESPVERLLILQEAEGFAPGRVPLAAAARGLLSEAERFASEDILESLIQQYQQRRIADLPARIDFISRGFDYEAAELAAARLRVTEMARAGDQSASEKLTEVKARQRRLAALRDRRLAELTAESDIVSAGQVEFLVHLLVVPATESDDTERYDADVEAIAMEVAVAHEESFGAEVKDVSKPALARRAGLPDWPGFDLLSIGSDGERRRIEVKGRAGTGSVEMRANEWANACIHCDEYWLYVAFDCATPRPRLLRIRDPFTRLLAKDRESVAYIITPGNVLEAAE